MEDNFALVNDGLGISIDVSGVVIGNRVLLAGGMSVGAGSVVSENDLTDCTGTAIVVQGSNCTVEENHVSGGSFGIAVASPAERVMVDGNPVTGGSNTGITVLAGTSRCLVVRNAVSPPVGVPGYSIAAGSSYGPIVNAVSVGDLGTSGTPNDPWSNFEY
jgi:hypothetical protein